MSEDKKKCFVIMPISDAEGYDKGHFTRVYEHLVKPAVIEAGFEPMRADDTSKANFIVVDILKQILESDMAICDLTYIIHSGFISGYQNRYGDNLKPPTNVYHRMTA